MANKTNSIDDPCFDLDCITSPRPITPDPTTAGRGVSKPVSFDHLERKKKIRLKIFHQDCYWIHDRIWLDDCI